MDPDRREPAITASRLAFLLAETIDEIEEDLTRPLPRQPSMFHRKAPSND